MATNTTNYNLKKPAKTDFYNIDDFNDNMDIIDTNMKRIDDKKVPTKTSELVNDNNFISDDKYVHTDNNFTTEEKTKLNGISSGAEVNSIDTIKVNGEIQTPINKEVDLIVPDELKGSTYTIPSSGWILNSTTNYFEHSISNQNITVNTFVDVVMDIPNQQKLSRSSILSYNGGFKVITSVEPTDAISITYTYQLVSNEG